MTFRIFDHGNTAGTRAGAIFVRSLCRRGAIRVIALLGALIALTGGSAAFAAEETSLAIKGYDPVAYFTDGKPTAGLPAFEYQWDDHVWRFVSAEHRDLFKADPVRYAPQFGNFCAMALAKGEVVVANPENWLINEGKLYVFGKPAPAGPALFQQNLADNIAKANHNRPILPQP
jgi:hypothetical protein